MKRAWVIFCICLAVAATFAGAQDDATELDALKRENEELRARVRQLETAVAEIRQMLAAPAAAPATGAAVAAAPTPPPSPGSAGTPAALARTDKVPVRSRFAVDLYGYVKADASWDSARTSSGNFVQWVESEPPGGPDSEFNMMIKETRLGLDFRGPDMAGARTSAKVEMDFMGGGAENKPVPMLRHAYVQLEWPAYDLTLTAGQTWDVISPLFPTSVNYSPGWWAGNVGYRRPQFRLTKGFRLGEGTKLTVQAAASRTIGDPAPFSPGDTGEDAGFPTVQGRVAVSFPALAGQTASLGVSGHYGQDEYDIDNNNAHVNIPSWSGSVELQLPLARAVVFKGELFRGRNMDEYLGGIGQGVNTATLRGITDVGGWAHLAFGPWRSWRFGVGYTTDDPVNRDLNAGDRMRNRSLFGNVFYDVNEAVQLGFEVASWQTLYRDKADGEAIRLQTALYYRF